MFRRLLKQAQYLLGRLPTHAPLRFLTLPDSQNAIDPLHRLT
jgi:hypothetical protein